MTTPVAGYVPIPIDKLLTGESATLDLYLRLSDSKYIKVVKAGDSFDKDRLRNFKDKKVETVFISELDFPHYIEACLELLRVLVKANRPGVEQDFSLSFHVAESVFQSLMYSGVNKDSIQHVVELGTVLSDQMKKKPQLGDFVEQLLEMDNAISRHSVAVASITLMILHGLRWQLKKNMDAILMGSLLHDIALLPYPEIYSEPESQWSEEAKKSYAEHTHHSAQLIKNSDSGLDSRIIDIIENHHEIPNGTGFPRGISGKDIHPMALPLIMADRLAELLLDPHGHLIERSLPRALRYLKNREENFYPASYWKALESWAI